MFFNAFRHKTGGDFYFKSNVVRNIQLTCQSSETGIFFYNRAFTSTNKLYLEHIQTDNCNGGYHTLSAEFRFLTKLTFSRAISPDLVYLPKSVTMLNITHSPEFQGVNLNGNPNDIIFPQLISLAIDYCSRVTNFVFLSHLPYLQRFFLNGNKMNDSAVADALNCLKLNTKETLLTLSLMDNGLTRIPETKIFSNLTDLMLDKNNITKLTNSSLQHFGSQLRILSLSSCGMELIEPGFFEG